MKTSYKILLAALALSIPATAAVASMKKNATGKEHAAMAMERFEAMDADKNGTVTQAEIFAHRSAQFAAADSNGDGKISAEELDGMMAEHRIKFMKRRLAMMDTDGDGSVGGEEFARMRDHWMWRLDQNRDGAIAKEELSGAGEHHGRRHGMSQGGHHAGQSGMHGQN